MKKIYILVSTMSVTTGHGRSDDIITLGMATYPKNGAHPAFSELKDAEKYLATLSDHTRPEIVAIELR